MCPVCVVGGRVTMVGTKWLLVLPLLVDLNIVTLQPTTNEAGRLDLSNCCPCPDYTRGDADARSPDDLTVDPRNHHCSCGARSDDAEASASILMPALRAMQPFVKLADQKTEPKPLLQPEVGLASSVLETLRQATDEEYQEALARDAARSAMKLLESTLDPLDDTIVGTPKNKVRIFLNKEGDDMDDNLPEPSHIQETRCIHSPLQSIHKQLRMNRPTPIVEVIELLPKPRRKLSNKGVLHRKFLDMDNGISASNIKERVIQPNLDHNLEHLNLKSNPTLFSLFTQNNLVKTGDQKKLQRNLSDESNHSEEIKSKIQAKLRELLDNLDIKRSKVPITDLKKYITPATRIPPLQLSPTEKTIHNNKPLLLKDLLKLKDVELIPRNYLTKSTNAKQPALKLQSESSRIDPNTDNCNVDNSNLVPLMNQDTEITTIPIYSDIADPEISPSNSNSVFASKGNVVNTNFNQSFKPNKSAANSISSVPADYEGNDNFDYSEQLSDNCNEVTGNYYMQQLPDIEIKETGLNNNNVRKEKVQKLYNNGDNIRRDESNNEPFQIEFLEDFDTPIEFDNSSFVPKSHVKNNDDVHLLNEDTLNDPVADTTNHVLQINSQNNEDIDIPQGVDCNSLKSFSKNSNFISENQGSEDKNSMQHVQSEDMIIAHNIVSNKNEDPSQVSFRDLQDMSNSILSLSECEPSREENVNTKSNFNEDLDHVNDDYDDMSNIVLPTSETISKEMETEDDPDIKSSINANGKLIQGSNIHSNEDLCKSTTFDESLSNINQAEVKKSIYSDEEKSEMRAEASEPKSKAYDHMDPLYCNTGDSDKNSNFFTKASAAFNDISKADKHSIFLNSLKSKLEGLFSTTEKLLPNNSDDNAKESSDINSVVAKSDKLQRTPQTLLRKFSLPELPGKSLNSLSDKLALPNFVNPPRPSNLFNLPNPFENVPEASLPFTALSDKLRSHTENTIQNVKETLSTLKDSPNFQLSRPTDTFDTHDILDSISNRRDEMKEKLEAIHLDLNDRFSSFQQSVLDHLSIPTENPKFQEGSNNGLRSSYIPLKQELEHNLLPQWKNAKKIGKHTEINILSSKIPTVPDATRLRQSGRKLQSPVLYTTTTPIPSFIPRPKVLKTNIGSTPRLTSETLLQARPSKTTVPKVSKIKSLSWNPDRTSNLSEESSSLSSRMHFPVKSFKTNTEKITKENLSIDSPVNKFRKALLQNNLKQNIRQEHAKSNQNLRKINLLENNGSSTTHESVLSRIKEGRGRPGSRNNEGMVLSPSSHLDTMHPSQKEPELRLVEPLKENVPYKCKLICYKDS